MTNNYTPKAIDKIQQAKISLNEAIHAGAELIQRSLANYKPNTLAKEAYAAFLLPANNQ